MPEFWALSRNSRRSGVISQRGMALSEWRSLLFCSAAKSGISLAYLPFTELKLRVRLLWAYALYMMVSLILSIHCLSIYLSIYLFIYLFIYHANIQSIFIYLSIVQAPSLSISLFVITCLTPNELISHHFMVFLMGQDLTIFMAFLMSQDLTIFMVFLMSQHLTILWCF